MRMLRVGCVLGLCGVWLQLGAADGIKISGHRVDVPVSVLRQRADLIVLGTVKQIERSDRGSEEVVQLEVRRVLQGQEPGSFLRVRLTRPSQIPSLSLPSSAVGESGIWFLKRGDSDYIVLPLVDGLYVQTDYYLPNNDSPTAAPPEGTVDQQLLAYLVRWYLSVASPGGYEDERIFSSLERTKVSREDALGAIGNILSSGSSAHHFVGLEAAIRAGSPDALTTVEAELSVLSSNAKFFNIIRAIRFFYQPSEESIGPLQRLIELHPDVPGLGAAAGAALWRLRTKAIAPAMARLLDSPDSEAQLIAAGFFGLYALFADENGYFRDSGPDGPFFTQETKQFMPQSDSGITPAEYAQFWKAWWSANYRKLGFTAP